MLSISLPYIRRRRHGLSLMPEFHAAAASFTALCLSCRCQMRHMYQIFGRLMLIPACFTTPA